MKSKIVSLFSSLGALLWGCIGGSCGIVCLASGCCGSTALFGFIGLSGASLGILNKLTPLFLVLTVVSLSYAFYRAYKPQPASCCSEKNSTVPTSCCENSKTENNYNSGTCCEKDRRKSFLKSKTFLWITTIACFIMWTYPYIFKNEMKKQPAPVSCCPSDSIPIGPKTFNIQGTPCCAK